MLYALLFITVPSQLLPNGAYVAPLKQESQPSYVPQSVALSGPTILKDWEPGMPIPAGYHPKKRKRTGMAGAGFGLFAGFYLTSAVIAGLNMDAKRYNGGGGEVMLLPIFGPFVEAGMTGSSAAAAMLVIDGLAQLGGIIMGIAGLTMPKLVWCGTTWATSAWIRRPAK